MVIRTLSVYHPGTSVLHRLPTVVKILGLVGWILALTLGCRHWTWLALPVSVVGVLLAVVRAPARLLWQQIWPTLPFLILIGAYQWWVLGWEEALRLVGIILCDILAAIVVTLTTRVTDMIDGYLLLLRPLEKLGVPTHYSAMAMALTLQAVSVISGIVQEVREALWCRGAGRSVRALIAPLLPRVLRYAEGVGDALVARGIDDSTSH